MNVVALLLALTLAYAGMLLFCLRMERHWKQLVSPAVPARLRHACGPLGTALLALAAYACGDIWQPGMAWVAWFGMISLTGLALVLMLPYAPRVALYLPLAGAFGAAVAGLS